MIAAWMLYCALCALGLSLAAVLAERALLAARGSVRYVWVAAVLLSFVVPAAAYRFAARPEVTDKSARRSSARRRAAARIRCPAIASMSIS